MKQYVIDELRPADHQRLKAFFDEHYGERHLPGVYWLALEEAHLAPTQRSHESCGPFYVAIILEQDSLTAEFLVRSQARLRCSCVDYATAEQRAHIMAQCDAVCRELGLIT